MKTMLLFALIFSHYAYAQHNINGDVLSFEGKPLQDVALLLQGTGYGTTSDQEGKFSITNIPAGDYILFVSSLGYSQQLIRVTVNDKHPDKISIIMTEDENQLNEVVVVATSESEVLKKSVASVSLIDIKPFHNRSISSVDILSRIPGVQVRQNGGVGNGAEISIQGLSGRQVKLFIDGIPMDFLLPVEELGIGSSLAMLPLNMMERIEAYKGAVPVSLGADALGGAVNIVTRKDIKDNFEFSAQRSSFDTWQGTLDLRKVNHTGFSVGLSGYYVSSDNDYQIDEVKVINGFGNPETISARKFHDAFRTYLIKAGAGFLNKRWADKAMLSFSYANLYDEIQHNFEMRQPYGQALNLASTYNSSFQYEKYGIKEKIDLNFYIGHNRINTSFIDTTRNIYGWRGDVIGIKSYGGEITTSQSYLQLAGDNISSRANIAYHISPSLRLLFNGVASFFTRKGEDPVAAEYYGEDFFRNPVRINKNVAGLGIEKDFLNQQLTSSTAVKIFQYRAEGFKIENGGANHIIQDQLQPGVSQSFKYSFSKKILGKLSYEYATRMPDRIEALGDFSAAINANPDLKPETSHNVNLGAMIKNKKWRIETSAFFRSVENIIILQPVPPPVLSKYENLLKTRVMGLESETQVSPLPWLTLRLGATYQDLRNRSGKEKAGVSSDRYYNARLPNRPYFFGNGEILIERGQVLHSKDKLQVWWSNNYVSEFFRYWEIDGRANEKLTIPNQLVNNCGAAYTWDNFALSIEAQNIFNTMAFDNFRVQKPGRSWHVKLRVSLTKTK